MTIDQIIGLSNFFQLSSIIRLFLIVLSFFYLIFSVVVYRQVSLMSQTVNTPLTSITRLLAVIQIIAVLGLLLLTLLLA